MIAFFIVVIIFMAISMTVKESKLQEKHKIAMQQVYNEKYQTEENYRREISNLKSCIKELKNENSFLSKYQTIADLKQEEEITKERIKQIKQEIDCSINNALITLADIKQATTEKIKNQSKDKILQEFIDFQLNNLEIDLFDPRNPDTFIYANEKKLAKVDNTFISYNGHYLSETEYVTWIKENFNRENNNIKDFFEFTRKKADGCLIRCGFILKSNLVINGYCFTLAQQEMIKSISRRDKEKLVNIIKEHFEKKEKKYRLSQEIFDKHINIDNMLFADLCYTDNLYSELEIMKTHFLGFEPESIEELEVILDNDYLNNYKGLKTRLYKMLVNLHELKK